jgi:D-serine deaminase-like pyridoxal phosphate-dependent protein
MTLDDIDTPAVLIDLDRVKANLARAQAYADAHGLRLRPHIKTHKLPLFARDQQALGAIRITAQKLGEAEAMADGGLTAALAALTDAGLPPPVISAGGSPGLYRAHLVTAATEHRHGTYIYSDRMQVAFGLGGWGDCALTVIATVVSRPSGTRAILDSGSKALGADLCPLPDRGRITAYPEAVITGLSEEHGHVDLSACTDRPAVGERVRVIPNHACVVTNLFDHVHLIRGNVVEELASVTSRGKLA